jgi:hypothetical protein
MLSNLGEADFWGGIASRIAGKYESNAEMETSTNRITHHKGVQIVA